MGFSEWREELKTLIFTRIRVNEPGYFEAVIVATDLPRLTGLLEKFFGAPIWPTQEQLTPQIDKLVGDYGGLQPGQSLYFWNEGIETVLAMLWPWSVGKLVTIKIVKKPSV